MIRFFKFHENIGAIFAILAFFLFAILDVFQKYGTIFHTVFQIMLCKYLFLFFLSLIESVRKKESTQEMLYSVMVISSVYRNFSKLGVKD